MIKVSVIEKYAEIFPNKDAIICGGFKLSWKDYAKVTSQALSKMMDFADLHKIERVAFLSENNPLTVILGSVFSSLSMGFIGVDYHQSAENITTVLNQANCSILFVSNDIKSKFAHSVFSGGNITVIGIEDFFKDMASYPSIETHILENFVKGRTYLSLAFTSGTTGVPKIVKRTVSFDQRRFSYLAERYKFDDNDVHLACLPLYHVGTTGWLRMFLGYGSTCVLHNFENAYQFAADIAKHNVSAILMAPLMLKKLIDFLEPDSKYPFPKLRFVITGGKNYGIQAKHRAIDKLGPIINEYYGTTESGINTLADPEDFIKYPGSVGRPFEGNKIVILDKNNHPITNSKIGRIAIHSYMNMDGYTNATSKFIEVEGLSYLVTSDFGYLNKDGYLFMVQRVLQEPDHIINLAAIENKIYFTLPVADIHSLQDPSSSNRVHLKIVPKYFAPYEHFQKSIAALLQEENLTLGEFSIEESLLYTPAGKIKLTPVSMH